MGETVGQPRTVTRDELYRMVWETPMARLATEFKVSGNGLAKACRRLEVPYPPRGYWAKKAAGKSAPVTKLPKARNDTPWTTEIWPTPASPPKLEAVTPRPEASAAAAVVKGLTVPDDISAVHPLVRGWIRQHQQDQQENEREKRKFGIILWGPIADLTERDLYRFRISSAIFHGVELAGGSVVSASIDGKAVFLVGGQRVECSIVERLVQSLRPREKLGLWTAYPGHHASHLTSSGYLRVSITTWLAGEKPKWLETDRQKIGDMLPQIIGAIFAAGPTLKEMARESEHRERLRLIEQARRDEERRQKELDDKRWSRFGDLASAWEASARLSSFIGEIEHRIGENGDAEVGGRKLSDWLSWAKIRAAQIDPLVGGPEDLFDSISKVAHRSW